MNPSHIIAGTMNWGAGGARLNTQGMATIIQAAMEAGITTFDHADIYGGYTTEADFGRGFEASGVARSSVQFVTKCGIRYPMDHAKHSVKHYDYSEEHIRRSLENSLAHLKTDYIDVYLLHRPSPLLGPEEAVGVLESLKREGKILSWGVSNFTRFQMEMMGKGLEWNQLECSLTHADPMVNGTLDWHQTHAVRTMAWSPLGTFFKGESPERTRLAPVVERLTEKYACSASNVLLAWLRRHPAQIVPVVGTTRPERLLDMSECNRVHLETEDWFALLEASWGHKVP